MNFRNLNFSDILNETFDDELTSDIYGVDKKRRLAPLSEYGKYMFSQVITKDLYDINVNENLANAKLLHQHYLKHVLTSEGDTFNTENDNTKKYNFMSEQDYYNYAVEVANLKPTIVINDLESFEDTFNAYNTFLFDRWGILKVDADCTNNNTGESVYVIFRKKSRYSKYIDYCIFNKVTNEPDSLFPITIVESAAKLNNLYLKYQDNK